MLWNCDLTRTLKINKKRGKLIISHNRVSACPLCNGTLGALWHRVIQSSVDWCKIAHWHLLYKLKLTVLLLLKVTGLPSNWQHSISERVLRLVGWAINREFWVFKSSPMEKFVWDSFSHQLRPSHWPYPVLMIGFVFILFIQFLCRSFLWLCTYFVSPACSEGTTSKWEILPRNTSRSSPSFSLCFTWVGWRYVSKILTPYEDQ